MLLANGYRLVDAAASKGPSGDQVAVAYISSNAGALFQKDQYYNDPFKYGGKDGSLTSEQAALIAGRPAPPAPSYTVGFGVYYGVGMEAEVGFNGLIPTDARLGLGVGIGAHGWIQGASQGGSVDLFSYGRNQNPGDYRVGSSASAGLVLGPITGQFGTSAGLYSNIVGSQETGFYWQSKGGIGVSPTFGVGAEAKLNIFDFSCKRN